MALLPRIRSTVDDAGMEDAAAMAEIHEQSFSRGWSEDEICELLSDRPIVHGIVVRTSALRRKGIAGFVLVRNAGDEAEILTVAVRPGHRRRGFGRMLVEEAARRAYRDRASSLFLEVDENNRAAVSLYRKLGFETVGQRSSYYQRADAPPGTALVMRLRLR